MPDRFYITTPIYYVNAEPHLGHAYTTLVADTMARYHRFCGDDTYFLTGTDEHGDKIQQAARIFEAQCPEGWKGGAVSEDHYRAYRNKDIEALFRHCQWYADDVSKKFQEAWKAMGISNDDFIRTTELRHHNVVNKLLTKIYEQGDIRKGAYEGLYCVGCERYYDPKELAEGKCPDHQVEPELRREENYFFNMEKYRSRLVEHIEKTPGFIMPERYRNEVLAMLREPIGELCITRPKSRLSWGIEVPFDPAYVVYVWFDALINYVSALGGTDGELFKKYWPVCHHLIAKDILKPHAIYWPTMLLAAGIPLYAGLRVHGFWNVSGLKMSKSVGNVRGAFEMKEKYGNEAFRYFVLREMSFGLDADFTEEKMVERINADLANGIGNLLARTTSMAQKYFPDGVPMVNLAPLELNLKINALGNQMNSCLGMAQGLHRRIQEAMDNFQIDVALSFIWTIIRRTDQLVSETKPWVIAKDPARKDELAAVIRVLLECVALVAANVAPFLPETAVKMARALGLDPDQLLDQRSLTKENIPAGHRIPGGGHLFSRIEPARK